MTDLVISLFNRLMIKQVHAYQFACWKDQDAFCGALQFKSFVFFGDSEPLYDSER